MASPNRLLLVTADLFFSAKISGTATELGWTVRSLSSAAALPPAEELAETRAILVDLELPTLNIAEFAELTAAPGPRLVGYAPHVKKHLFEQAAQAGFDESLSRGALAASLVERLQDWAQ